MVRSVLGLIMVGLVALVISLVSSGQTSGNGCIAVTAAAATGGTTLYRCGAEARALCAEPVPPGGSNSSLRGALVVECRKAGLPVPR
jgi:hypothetical protein